MAGLLMGIGAMDGAEAFKWFSEVSPASNLELEWKDKISPIDVEILFHKMSLIAYAGKETMVKVGTTPGMTGTDLNCAIYTAAGDVSVGGMGVYGHALSGQGPIKYFKIYYGESVGVRDGDLFFVSDPYIGGSHVNDQFLAAPIFVDGELVAWVTSGCHQTEVGAVDIGMSCTSKNRFGDGMNVTTIKVGENMILRDDLVCALANMTRDPQSWILDLKARYAAIVHMRKELLKLGKEKGAGFIAGGLRRLIEDTMRRASEKIAELNDGTYRGVIFSDTIGDTVSLQRIVFELTKKGDALEFNFQGTSPQCPGSMNVYSFIVPTSMMTYSMSYLFHDLPTSLGAIYPIKKYDLPEKSIINADVGCSVSVGVVTAFQINTLVHNTMNKMIFGCEKFRDSVAAPQGWMLDAMQFVVLNQHGLRNSGFMMDINAQGQGGRYVGDGTHSMNPPWAALADCLETEWYEKDFPYVYLFRKHAPDSGGFGKHRGGSGMESGWFVHNLKSGAMTSVGAAVKVPTAIGVFGGYAAITGPGLNVWKSNVYELIENNVRLPKNRHEVVNAFQGETYLGARFIKMRDLNTGDVLTSQNNGGGGYGDVLERDPAAIIDDLREQVITPWTAKNVYKIVFDEEALTLDEKKTEDLRKKEHANRAKLGKKYSEFVKQWSKLKPKADLTYFGTWPEEQL